LGLQGVVSPSFGTMAVFSLLALEVTQEHLQNLMSQGYMTAAELVTYRVLEDPASPIMAGVYMIVAVFMTLCVAYMGIGPHFNL
jgi:hypothetical protein